MSATCCDEEASSGFLSALNKKIIFKIKKLFKKLLLSRIKRGKRREMP